MTMITERITEILVRERERERVFYQLIALHENVTGTNHDNDDDDDNNNNNM